MLSHISPANARQIHAALPFSLRLGFDKSSYTCRYMVRRKDKRVSSHLPANPHEFLVPEIGVEPTTFALRMRVMLYLPAFLTVDMLSVRSMKINKLGRLLPSR